MEPIMTNIKCKVMTFCAFLMLVTTICFAHAQKDCEQLGLTKVYVLHETIVFMDGRLLIADGQNLLNVKTLHQDGEGVYYYHASLYGYCPNGHPYTADGGCLGYDCPYN
jgi:hypothetical protein